MAATIYLKFYFLNQIFFSIFYFFFRFFSISISPNLCSKLKTWWSLTHNICVGNREIILIGNHEIKWPRICHDFKTANLNSHEFKWGYSMVQGLCVWFTSITNQSRRKYCKTRNIGGYYIWRFWKISQFSKDLIWRYYWKKVVEVHICFIWWLLILAKFINSPISPNKSLPIIDRFTVAHV